MSEFSSAKVGFVAIGRNEGARFKRCLESLLNAGDRVIYVDSGSTDDSVSFAEHSGAEVVLLDTEKPFTAARARNAGFSALVEKWPDTEYIMFIDGDCVLVDGFAEAAIAAFDDDPGIGVVTGRCRERRPDATIYNRLCDLEWNGPVGDIDACGGIFIARAGVFNSIGGFNETIIAAEDDDFCIRVRNLGCRVVRIGREMCLHDANMSHFGQWWRRATRAGYAFAQLGELHGRYFRAERLRAWGWAGALPAGIIIGAAFTNGAALFLALLYPASFLRTRQKLITSGETAKHATLGAAFLTLAKFPNLLGILRYRWKKLTGEKIGIVEYK